MPLVPQVIDSIRGHRHIGFDDDGHRGRDAEHGVDGHRLPLARRQRELMRDDAPALAQQGERDVRRLGGAQIEHRHRRVEEARRAFGEVPGVPAHGMPPRRILLRVRQAIAIGVAGGVARVVRIEPEERLPRVRHRVAVGVGLLGGHPGRVEQQGGAGRVGGGPRHGHNGRGQRQPPDPPQSRSHRPAGGACAWRQHGATTCQLSR